MACARAPALPSRSAPARRDEVQALHVLCLDAVLGCVPHHTKALVLRLVCRDLRAALARPADRLVRASQPAPLWALQLGWEAWSARQHAALAHTAGRAGDMEVLAWIAGLDRNLWRLATAAAAGAGRLDVVQHLYPQGGASAAFCFAAAGGGHIAVLRWLRGQRPRCRWCVQACVAAAGGGHLAVLQWMLGQPDPCPLNPWWTCVAAAGGGHLAVLQWLRGQRCAWDDRACHAAAAGGHLTVLQWMRAQQPPCPWAAEGCAAAATAHGHLDVLQWVRAQQPSCRLDAELCDAAARGGHLDVLQWLRAQQPPCRWYGTSIDAARGGHLDVLRWLRAQTPPCPWGAVTCEAAARGGHLDVLMWLRAQTPPCPWDARVCAAAQQRGHLGMLQWATDNGCPNVV